jgi:hypothetical protein
MPFLPTPHWVMHDNIPCWMLDWREFFRSGLLDARLGGQMRGFQVRFNIRVRASGVLVFWDDDGCIIRRNGMIVHQDREAHPLHRSELSVEAGEVLEVAQWQWVGDWLWGARIDDLRTPDHSAPDDLLSYLPLVEERLRHPNGPVLKFFTDGRSPHRAVLALYSLVLNGYAPARVALYGESQWSRVAREWFGSALPFGEVVCTNGIISRAGMLGGPRLADWARRYWWVMKACIAFFDGDDEFAVLDDDVFVLDAVDDALEMFRTHDLVYVPDTDHGREYTMAWGRVFPQSGPLKTGNLNTGLYWCRPIEDARRLARKMLHMSPAGSPSWYWEQGFIAAAYSQREVQALPSARYFYPLFDGLPGGILGYDYFHNPCGFATIHFGGLQEKPSEAAVEYLIPHVLRRP